MGETLIKLSCELERESPVGLAVAETAAVGGWGVSVTWLKSWVVNCGPCGQRGCRFQCALYGTLSGVHMVGVLWNVVVGGAFNVGPHALAHVRE